MSVRLLVMAKAPVPGQVKTRLCPPCTPEQAAVVARASLEQTLRRHGLRVVRGPLLQDVDTAAAAHEVTRLVPGSPFAAAVRANVPVESLVTATGGTSNR